MLDSILGVGDPTWMSGGDLCAHPKIHSIPPGFGCANFVGSLGLKPGFENIRNAHRMTKRLAYEDLTLYIYDKGCIFRGIRQINSTCQNLLKFDQFRTPLSMQGVFDNDPLTRPDIFPAQLQAARRQSRCTLSSQGGEGLPQHHFHTSPEKSQHHFHTSPEESRIANNPNDLPDSEP